jgi:predicted ribosome quality control (RQC) complex YloA/Tae2 family protein
MHEMTALELGVVMAELKPRLANSFMKKFYDLGNGAYRMSFHGAEGNMEIYISLLHTINETKFKEELGEATKFAMAVRKRIDDSRVFNVYQHGSDRIAILEFGTQDGRYKLILEMFGKGNLVIVNEGGKIEVCSMSVNYRDRSVRPGFDYIMPKSESVELDKLKGEEIERIMDSVSGSQNKMITEISKFINIGPVYLDEVIKGAGLDPRNALSHNDVAKLTEAFVKFFESLKNTKPVVYLQNGKSVDYSLVPLSKYRELEHKEFYSLSEALDEAHIESRHSDGDGGAGKDLEELNSTIDRQKELVKQFEDESVEAAQIAKTISQNMNEINHIVYYMQENRRATLEEVKKEFPNIKIEKINLKDKKITLEM